MRPRGAAPGRAVGIFKHGIGSISAKAALPDGWRSHYDAVIGGGRTMDALLIVSGLVVAGFVVWKLFLGAVKGVSKAVSEGVAEGRGAVAPLPPPARASEEETTNLQDELMMATYHLGVSELERDPKAYG